VLIVDVGKWTLDTDTGGGKRSNLSNPKKNPSSIFFDRRTDFNQPSLKKSISPANRYNRITKVVDGTLSSVVVVNNIGA
jgi:hypothetical protein